MTRRNIGGSQYRQIFGGRCCKGKQIHGVVAGKGEVDLREGF